MYTQRKAFVLMSLKSAEQLKLHSCNLPYPLKLLTKSPTDLPPSSNVMSSADLTSESPILSQRMRVSVAHHNCTRYPKVLPAISGRAQLQKRLVNTRCPVKRRLEKLQLDCTVPAGAGAHVSFHKFRRRLQESAEHLKVYFSSLATLHLQ